MFCPPNQLPPTHRNGGTELYIYRIAYWL